MASFAPPSGWIADQAYEDHRLHIKTRAQLGGQRPLEAFALVTLWLNTGIDRMNNIAANALRGVALGRVDELMPWQPVNVSSAT